MSQVMPKMAGYRVERGNLEFSWSHLENLQLADPYYFQNKKVDTPLGSEFHAQIVEREVIKDTSPELIATKSQIGWIISGSAGSGLHPQLVSIHCTDNTYLSVLITKFW